MKPNTKPCLQCGEECEIYPLMLGDAFTLTYLRLCSPECLFRQVYEYLYSIGSHKDFRNYLYRLQLPEDEKQRDEFFEKTTNSFLEDQSKNFKKNPDILSKPAPSFILDRFAQIPQKNPETIRLTRPSREQKLKWQKEAVEKLKKSLTEALKDLEELENEEKIDA